MKYDVAFSFASEQKEIVEEFKKKLQNLRLKVFVDDDHPELFVSGYVPDILKDIYINESKLMIIFLSQDYVSKKFPSYEGHIALDRLISGKKVEIIKLDDAEMPGLPDSLHFFDLRDVNHDTSYICEAIYHAISGADCINLGRLFDNLNIQLASNTKYYNKKYASKTCYIYEIPKRNNICIKIVLCTEEKSILFFSDTLCVDMSIPLAAIELSDNEYIFYNMGISETNKTICKFILEEELLYYIISEIKGFAEKI